MKQFEYGNDKGMLYNEGDGTSQCILNLLETFDSSDIKWMKANSYNRMNMRGGNSEGSEVDGVLDKVEMIAMVNPKVSHVSGERGRGA